MGSTPEERQKELNEGLYAAIKRTVEQYQTDPEFRKQMALEETLNLERFQIAMAELRKGEAASRIARGHVRYNG